MFFSGLLCGSTLVGRVLLLLVAAAGVHLAQARDCAENTFWRRFVRSDSAALAGAPVTYNLSSARWYGRAGNNEIEIHQALNYAVCCDAVLAIMPNTNFPKLHQFLDFRDGSVPKREPAFNKTASCGGSLSGSITFFGRRRLLNDEERPNNWYPAPICSYDAYAALSYVMYDNTQPRWCGAPAGRCAQGLEDALVVHIRSGDVFDVRSDGKVRKEYIQPPVQFYERVFALRNWTRIILLTEPATGVFLNPVWTHFLGKPWPGATMVFQMSSSLEEDMRTLWCATTMIFAKSTLSTVFFDTSSTLREYHQASYFNSGADCPAQKVDGMQCFTYLLDDTYSKIPWTSPADREHGMLHYNGSIHVQHN